MPEGAIAACVTAVVVGAFVIALKVIVPLVQHIAVALSQI